VLFKVNLVLLKLTPLLGLSDSTFSPFLISPAGELATLAFLVVLRLLIKLFFWMDMAGKSPLFSFESVGRIGIEHTGCQTAIRTCKSAAC
jgi:hypothetical protein